MVRKTLSILVVFGVGLFCGVFWGGVAWFINCALTESTFQELSSPSIITPAVIGAALFFLGTAGAYKEWFKDNKTG